MIRLVLLLLCLAVPAQAQRQMVAAAHPMAAEAGPRHAARRRHRHRRRRRRPGHAGAGGAAILRPRRRRADAAAGMPPAGASPPGTAARPPPPPRRRRCSSGTASRWASSRPRSAAAPSACPAPCACWKPRIAAHGRLPWAQLFAPAIAAAEEGFVVSAAPGRACRGWRPSGCAATRRPAPISCPTASRSAEGARLRNPALAATLRAIAEQGADALHRGPIAAEIAGAVRGHAPTPAC